MKNTFSLGSNIAVLTKTKVQELFITQKEGDDFCTISIRPEPFAKPYDLCDIYLEDMKDLAMSLNNYFTTLENDNA